MSKVLVTGGAGSMGRLVTEKLISKGFIVKIFDLPSANYLVVNIKLILLDSRKKNNCMKI